MNQRVLKFIEDNKDAINRADFSYLCAKTEKDLIYTNHISLFYVIMRSAGFDFIKETDTIPGSYYAHMKMEKGFEIPEGVTSIGDYAFYKTSGLEYLFIPKSVKYIGTMTLAHSDNLRTIEYDGTLEEFSKIQFEFRCFDDDVFTMQTRMFKFIDVTKSLNQLIQDGVINS